MFFLPVSRFRLIRVYHEDPTGTTFVSYSKRTLLFRFLTLLFYSFLYNNSTRIPFVFTSFRKPYWSWVYKNKHKVVQWDALRRYNYKLIARLKSTLYKKRLLEYKKLKYFYFSLRDHQFRKLSLKGLPLYTRFNSHFLSFLELRLLTFCVRLGIFDTHIQGRQEIRHFGIVIDNKRIYHTNYVLKVGSVLSLTKFIGFNNFLIGFDSAYQPAFSFKHYGRKKWRNIVKNLAWSISGGYNTATRYFWKWYDRFDAMRFSGKKVRLKRRKFKDSRVAPTRSRLLGKYYKLRYFRRISKDFNLLRFGFFDRRMRSNWLKLMEYTAFKSPRRRLLRLKQGWRQRIPKFKKSYFNQNHKYFFKRDSRKPRLLKSSKDYNRVSRSYKFSKKPLNPIVYDRQFEGRPYQFNLLKSIALQVRRGVKFDRSLLSLYFGVSKSYRTYFHRKIFLRVRRKIFKLLPKPYMLVSWALRKVYLVRAPGLDDVEFPFLSDPVLAFSFISNR